MIELQGEGAPSRAARPRVSVVIPCLNEAPSIDQCVSRAWEVLREAGIDGEVIVSDNASEDGSAAIAAAAGARVVHEARRGYGNAYLAGFAAARGDFIVMLDADLTYDFADIPRFVSALEDGADFVIGDRMDNIHPGAMPWLHEKVGNPVLSGMLNLLTDNSVKDAHCGFRAIRSEMIPRLNLKTPGMEFATEMVLQVSQNGLKTVELPIEYHRRVGESKLSTFGDGWRHLLYMLADSRVRWFIASGAVLVVGGIALVLLVLLGVRELDAGWRPHTIVGGALLVVIGFQIVTLGLCAQLHDPDEPWLRTEAARFRLEDALLWAIGVTTVGAVLLAWAIFRWLLDVAGSDDFELAVLAATVLVVGLQAFFCTWLLIVLSLQRPRRRRSAPGRAGS